MKVSVKILKLTYQMIFKSSESLMHRNDERNTIKLKLENFKFYFLSNSPQKSTPLIQIDFEHQLVKRKIEGSNLDEN